MDKTKDNKDNISNRMDFVMVIMAIGGAMDAYSYLVRGKVFATGQTGNFTLVAIYLVQRNIMGALHAILAIAAFWLGIFVCLSLFYRVAKEKDILWKRNTLILEFIIMLIVGFIPVTVKSVMVNPLISFAAAMQFCAFRKVGENDGYASVFCTGNMRTCSENYYRGLIRKDKEALKRAYRYTAILLAFFTGAVIMAVLSSLVHEKAIWLVNALLIYLIFCF